MQIHSFSHRMSQDVLNVLHIVAYVPSPYRPISLWALRLEVTGGFAQFGTHNDTGGAKLAVAHLD